MRGNASSAKVSMISFYCSLPVLTMAPVHPEDFRCAGTGWLNGPLASLRKSRMGTKET